VIVVSTIVVVKLIAIGSVRDVRKVEIDVQGIHELRRGLLMFSIIQQRSWRLM